ncbi:nitrilase [Nitratiruptor sp. YY08-26]|uniref:carbon-nitrogen hydrolase family protein n=1 Tax=unclassified Nitratiruptor TaxID=2624044 RepID=UPI0019165B7D|nr:MULTISPECIES: carbon-nitrogen hydrolase family protein [unclassified Nitratiruptor]BCD62573.1 nitrilase [Nitratiruptor sp. YY08-13]BCD66509.1 nitrilase [Nitratiruptor sp. YY08-26]
MNIAALQISSLGLSPNRLDYYCRTAATKNVKVLLLPEYVLNPFFGELQEIPKNMLLQQTQTHLDILKDLSLKYDLVIVAPVIRGYKGSLYKSIALVRSGKTYYYNQQILINYPHWNEERFFDNPVQKLEAPLVFRIDGVKFGILPGFEIHFASLWNALAKKDVNVVLVPSASTFGSTQRWREILQSMAFMYNFYVIRANRIGEYRDKDGNIWDFYGDSMSIDPGGKILVNLGKKEEFLIEHIDKKIVKEAKKSWGFRHALKKRGAL